MFIEKLHHRYLLFVFLGLLLCFGMGSSNTFAMNIVAEQDNIDDKDYSIQSDTPAVREDWKYLFDITFRSFFNISSTVFDLDQDGSKEILLPAYNGTVLAISGLFGSLKWRYDLNITLSAEPVIYNNGTHVIILMVDLGGTFYMINGADGLLIKHLEFATKLSFNGVMIVSSNLADLFYLGTDDGSVYEIDLKAYSSSLIVDLGKPLTQPLMDVEHDGIVLVDFLSGLLVVHGK